MSGTRPVSRALPAYGGSDSGSGIATVQPCAGTLDLVTAGPGTDELSELPQRLGRRQRQGLQLVSRHRNTAADTTEGAIGGAAIEEGGEHARGHRWTAGCRPQHIEMGLDHD